MPPDNNPQPTRSPVPPQQQAAADLVRNQIDNIYASSNGEEASPYQKTHSVAANVQAEEWAKYHSAWQQYYQQYYERYYLNQLYRVNGPERADQTPDGVPTPANAPRQEAIRALRRNLRANVRDAADRVHRSRHFMPIASALAVMLLFLFLQFNQVIFGSVHAYISPGNIDPANVIVEPSGNIPVGPEPKLIIPKINVEVPIVFDATPDYDSQMAAMAKGVAWFGIPGANSKPGQIGNTVLSGHSSNDLIDPGAYKFIFARLDQLQTGDSIYINYQGQRYAYRVTKKEVVKPTDVQKLIYPTDKPILTLITCTPVGTALNRLLVTAEQVSPNTKSAQPAPLETTPNEAEAVMPGNAPTILERIFR